MTNNLIDRVKEFITQKGFSETELANKLDMSQKTINNYMNGSRKISYEFIKSLTRTFELNANWLISGKGEMYTNDEIRDTPDSTNNQIYTMGEPIADYLPTSNFKLLPLQSFDVAGGSNNQESDTMGYIMGYMPFVNAKDGDIAVLVTGNSMYPTYPSGSYVQIRRIDYWHKFVEFGQVHIIELMDDRRLIKEVRKGSDKEHFKLISHNTSFDEVEVPTDFIRSVWLVLAKYEKSTM